MSDSHISDDWWLLLKDYTFPNNFSDEYLTSITTRLGQMKAGQLNEKVNIGRGDQSHYSQRKTERYKPNQKINHKGFGNHTPEEVATLMANDLLNTHPELLEAMHKEIPAPDPKHGETTPSMQFHLFNTDEPVTDSQYGPIRQFNPIFALGEDGKVGLKTVFGGQRPAASDRHTIRVTPTTSPASGHMNSHIHEDLPSRFDFRETKQPENLPSQVETPVEESSQLHPRHAEMMSIYNLPDSFRLPALQNKNIDATEFNQWMADSKLASEPMDIAWRFLKMPMVDTDVPGLRMAYGDDTDKKVIGMQPAFPNTPDEYYQRNIMQMTPNEYFDIIQDFAEKQGGIDRTHFVAPPIPGREADFRWDNMKYTSLLPSSEAEKYRHISSPSQRNIARIIDGIKSGMPIGMPYLGYTADGEHDGFQDGGHRMESLRQMGHGDTPVPVFRFQDEE